MMLGTYSFKKGETRAFRYIHASGTLFFKLSPSGPSVCVLQFYKDAIFTDPLVTAAPPPGISVLLYVAGPLMVPVPWAAPLGFLLAWTDHYVVKYMGVDIFGLDNPRQSTAKALGGADVVPLPPLPPQAAAPPHPASPGCIK